MRTRAERAARLGSFLGMALLCAGCFSHLHGRPMRGVDLQARQRVYVEQGPDDWHDIAPIVAARLRESGFDVSVGPPEKAPSDVQAIVSHEDHWGGLVRSDLITLRIDFRDPKTNELLASGQSYHAGMPPKAPGVVVDEIVTTILDAS